MSAIKHNVVLGNRVIHRRMNSDPTAILNLRSQQKQFMKHNHPLLSKSGKVPSEDIDTLTKELEYVIEKHGEKSVEFARLYNHIGNAYFKIENFVKACEAYSKAHHTYETVGGPTHPYVAVSLGNLGTAQWKMGDYRSSVRSLEESVRILHLKSGGSDDDVMVAEALHNLGTVKVLMKDFEGAKAVLERALNGRIKMLGRYHVDVARTRDALGFVFMKTGDIKKANKQHNKALLAKRNTLGPQHPSTIVSLMNLGRVHREECDYDAAIEIYREVFEVQSKMYFDTAMVIESGVTMHIIGDIQVENMSYFAALSSFRQALAIFEEAGLGNNDRRVVAVQKSENTARGEVVNNENDLFIVRESSWGSGE